MDPALSSDDSMEEDAATQAAVRELDEDLESWVRGLDVGPDVIELFKYIDDTTSVEIVSKLVTLKHFTTSRTIENVPAHLTRQILRRIAARSEEIGMSVNCKKTQLLCVSADNGCDSVAEISVNNEVIRSQDSVKVLGFMIGKSPGVHDQVQLMKNKFRARFWSLIHLRRAGFKGNSLFNLYCIFVRPVLEANSVVFHSMLNKGQINDIEKMHRKVVRLCYGLDEPSAALMQANEIRTLEHRRELAVRKFALKSLNDPRFGPKWFKRRDDISQNIRARKPYREIRAKTARYYNSPLANLIRTVNCISTSS